METSKYLFFLLYEPFTIYFVKKKLENLVT